MRPTRLQIIDTVLDMLRNGKIREAISYLETMREKVLKELNTRTMSRRKTQQRIDKEELLKMCYDVIRKEIEKNEMLKPALSMLEKIIMARR